MQMWPVRVVVFLLVGGMLTGCQIARQHETPAQPPAERDVREEFWPNGQLHVRTEFVRGDDETWLKDGVYTEWYEDGQKCAEVHYVRDKLDGVMTRWHPNGQMHVERHYRNGLRHGRTRIWDEKGHLRKEEFHFEGQPDGTWTTWKTDGSIRHRQQFQRGESVP